MAMTGNPVKSFIPWFVVFLLVIILVWGVSTAQREQGRIGFSEFLEHIEKGEVRKVVLRGNDISGEFKKKENGEPVKFQTFAPDWDKMVSFLREHEIPFEAKEPNRGALLSNLIFWAPFFLLIGVWIFLMRQMQAGGNKALSFGEQY